MNSFQEWWSEVPEKEKNGLKVFLGLLLAVYVIGGLSAVLQFFLG